MSTTPYVFDERMRAVASGRVRYHHSMKARLRPNRIIFVLLMTLAAMLVCGVLWLWVAQTWRDWHYFRTAASTAGATVVDRSISVSNDSTTYYVTYEFRYVPANGDPRTATDTDSVSWRIYNTATPGSELTIFYDPADPSRSYAEPPTLLRTSLITLAALAMLPLALMLLIPLWESVQEWMYQRNRWLQPIGQLCHGTISSITPDSAATQPDAWVWVSVHYSFTDPAGAVITNTKQCRIRGDKIPPKGTPIAVWYISKRQHILL